jgi:hypothetical protein
MVANTQRGERRRDAGQRGFTYVAMLFALVLFGVGLAALGESWSAVSQRARENELIEIGTTYVKAIGSYYERSPGGQKQYPERIDELLEDRRFVGLVRHMRKLYRDPVARGDWVLIRTADGRIRGIRSASDMPVFRTRPLVTVNALVVAGAHYSDWKFVYQPRAENSR